MNCRIPSGTLGPCDLSWGHEGAMHASEGDGFYNRRFEAEHRLHQQLRATRRPWTFCMTCLALGRPHERAYDAR